jgi:citrate/tricarballylate utilization protein
MQTLDSLVDSARALAAGQSLTAAEAEVARQMQICNACRYCEGFCGVFPAMTRRLSFGAADVHFLANLCHNCGACLHACQYAPPHEFAVNVPKSMAVLRGQTYTQYAWPAGLGRLYRYNGLAMTLALSMVMSLFLGLEMDSTPRGATGFYDLLPHELMVKVFAPVFLFAVLALALGVRRFWRDIGPATTGAAVSPPAALDAAGKVLSLQYLGGGHGEGCNDADDRFSLVRRRFHHLTFYGFLLCFAATSVATLYHYVLGWPAPYDLPSLPKLLGVGGGLALVAGTLGLFVLRLVRHPLHGDAAQKPMDLGFILLLFLIAASGLALLPLRGIPMLRPTLALHLGSVMALFATLPYGKFAHGIFRTAALLRHAVEKRQAPGLKLGAD